MTTWEPGHPAACIHHSFGSLVGSKETMSLSSDVRPTRISVVGMSSSSFTSFPDAYAKYGRRGPVLLTFFTFFGPRGGFGGGASDIPNFIANSAHSCHFESSSLFFFPPVKFSTIASSVRTSSNRFFFSSTSDSKKSTSGHSSNISVVAFGFSNNSFIFSFDSRNFVVAFATFFNAFVSCLLVSWRNPETSKFTTVLLGVGFESSSSSSKEEQHGRDRRGFLSASFKEKERVFNFVLVDDFWRRSFESATTTRGIPIIARGGGGTIVVRTKISILSKI